MSHADDHVARIVAQWAAERPDVDTRGMAVLGRLARLEHRIRPALAEVFEAHGLQAWEFDVLASLRRQGEPFQATAGELMASMMISSGSMTNRIDRLAQRGLVERRRDPDDGRVVVVGLTALGRSTVDAAVGDHAANQTRLVAGLTESERQQLEALLRSLEASLAD